MVTACLPPFFQSQVDSGSCHHNGPNFYIGSVTPGSLITDLHRDDEGGADAWHQNEIGYSQCVVFDRVNSAKWDELKAKCNVKGSGGHNHVSSP